MATPVLQLVIARHGAKQQRQLHLGEVADVLGRSATARRADADGRVVGANRGHWSRQIRTLAISSKG